MDSNEGQRLKGTCPVDGHVHFHSVDRVPITLDAAAANFRLIGKTDSNFRGVLLLTQACGEHVFETLRDRTFCGDWKLRPAVDEDQSLVADRGEDVIIVICGRQVRCERGLEATALGTTRQFADGRSLNETIREIQDSGALCTLPWGFGKWMGARGRLVRSALHKHPPESLAVCDNGSRLHFLGRPVLIRKAEKSGFMILPGTDPFPFGDDYRRVGSFGFLAGVPGNDRPWSDLRDWLTKQGNFPSVYGRALGPVRFLVNNVGIQVHNRGKRN